MTESLISEPRSLLVSHGLPSATRREPAGRRVLPSRRGNRLRARLAVHEQELTHRDDVIHELTRELDGVRRALEHALDERARLTREVANLEGICSQNRENARTLFDAARDQHAAVGELERALAVALDAS
jgi:chromosome segregation ATPase